MGHQPAERADAQPVAGGAVGAGVGEEPADHARAPGRPGACRPRPRHAPERGDQDQRPPVAQIGCGAVDARWRGRGSSEVMTRPSSPGPHGPLRAVPRRVGCGAPGLPYRGRGHEGSDEFDAFYKDARDRLLLQTYALTGDLPGRPARGPGRVRRGLAPLAQGLAARGPGGWVAAAGLDPRPAPPQRPALAPGEGRWTPSVTRHPRRARQAAGHPAQGAAAHPPHPVSMDEHGPRGRAPPGRRRARAAVARPRVRHAPRRATTAIRGALEALARRTSRPTSAGRAPRSSGGPARRAGAYRTPVVGAAGAVAALVVPAALVTDAAGGVRPHA